MKQRLFLAWLSLVCLCAEGAEPAAGFDTNRFHPVPLEKFYQRRLETYGSRDAWGAVPRGIIEFEGIPFRMFGKIELNGLGPTRNRNYLQTRLGEIPVKQKASRLHFISGAGYKDPDGTPLAEVRLHYTNGETRNIFINYCDHVRNWHVESDEKRRDLGHRNSRIVWDGTNGATGRPLRLFMNTFDNPLPGVEVKGIELLSLFGTAFPLFCAITLENVGYDIPPRPEAEEPDDTELRREMLVRILNDTTGNPHTNAFLRISAIEDGKMLNFGGYKTDQHGQILLDYPPAKFEALRFDAFADGFTLQTVTNNQVEGLFPAQTVVRLKEKQSLPGDSKLIEKPPAKEK